MNIKSIKKNDNVIVLTVVAPGQTEHSPVKGPNANLHHAERITDEALAARFKALSPNKNALQCAELDSGSLNNEYEHLFSASAGDTMSQIEAQEHASILRSFLTAYTQADCVVKPNTVANQALSTTNPVVVHTQNPRVNVFENRPVLNPISGTNKVGVDPVYNTTVVP